MDAGNLAVMSVLQKVEFFLYFKFNVINKDLQMVNKFIEAQIITGLKNNDSRVCRYLFDTHYTPLLYFAEKIIADQDEAEDIIIQAFKCDWSSRSEEHTSELQSHLNLVCRLLLEIGRAHV